MKPEDSPYVQSNVVIVASNDPHQDLMREFMSRAQVHSRLMIGMLLCSALNFFVGSGALWYFSVDIKLNAAISAYFIAIVGLYAYAYKCRKTVNPSPFSFMRFSSILLWLVGSALICWGLHFLRDELKMVFLIILMTLCFIWWLLWAHYFHRYFIFLSMNNHILKAMQGLIV